MKNLEKMYGRSVEELKELGYDYQELYDMGLIQRNDDKNIGMHVLNDNGELLEDELCTVGPNIRIKTPRKAKETENTL